MSEKPPRRTTDKNRTVPSAPAARSNPNRTLESEAGYPEKLLEAAEEPDEWGDDEATHDRGTHPPKPSSSRRLSPTLMKVFQRRREQVGLSIKQVAKLAGIEEAEYARFEGTQGNHRLVYDHVIVVARVLGVPPHELPGLRLRAPTGDGKAIIADVERALRAGLVLVFEGTQGERFVGDAERVGATPSFALEVGDVSLSPTWPVKTLLGFVAESRPQPGQVVVLRNRMSHFLALRRFSPPSYLGIAPWQAAYVAGSGEWVCVARLQVVLPP